jgi:hypothetical protein
MREVKMRYRLSGLAPRRTKLEIPGWAGDRSPRADGMREQVWHCMPFTEGAQYGIEIFYPYENELRVTMREGKLLLEGDFGEAPDPTLHRRSAISETSTTRISCCWISTPAKATRSALSRIPGSTPTGAATYQSPFPHWSVTGGRCSISWSSSRRWRGKLTFSGPASRWRKSSFFPRRPNSI